MKQDPSFGNDLAQIRENGGKKAVAEENLDVTLKELSSDVTTLD